jgi:hypothetical protein
MKAKIQQVFEASDDIVVKIKLRENRRRQKTKGLQATFSNTEATQKMVYEAYKSR